MNDKIRNAYIEGKKKIDTTVNKEIEKLNNMVSIGLIADSERLDIMTKILDYRRNAFEYMRSLIETFPDKQFEIHWDFRGIL